MKMPKNLGITQLAIWRILWDVLPPAGKLIRSSGSMLALLTIAAGILILLKR